MKLSRKAYLVIIPAFIAGNVQARAYIADSNPEYICAQGIYEPSDSSRTIEEIAVVARSNRVVVPGQTLSGEELNALGSHSVADAIRYFSGVEIKDYGGVGGLKTVNIRSMGSKHVGVFYDGLQINNAQNGVVDLGRLSLENMEAVSLYNGQKSAIFQPAKDFASSSAIYLTTRKPSFEGKTKHNLKATVKSGSFGLIDPSLLWEGRLSKNLSASVNAEYLYTNGRYKYRTSREAGYDTTEVRRNGDIRAVRADANLFGHIRGGEWKTKIYFYNSERGYPGADVRNGPINEGRQWDNALFAQGSLRKALGGIYSLMLNAKYSYDRMRYRSAPDVIPFVDNTYNQQEGYFSLANEFTPTRWWSISLAADVQFNTLDSDMQGFAYPSRLALYTVLATSLQFEKFTAQASLLSTDAADETKTGRAAGRKGDFSPTLIISYKPWKKHDFTLRALYKEVFRLPTFNELYYVKIGNNDLLPESTTQYNAGITIAKEYGSGFVRSLRFEADAYYNVVSDMIVSIPKNDAFTWTTMNIGWAEIIGADLKFRGHWAVGGVRIGTLLNYTFQKTHTRDRTIGVEFYGDPLPYIPEHSGTVVLGVRWKKWQFNYSFIYTGERYAISAATPENYVRPWYTHDISASRAIRLGSTELKAAAEINNIFNQQYEVVKRFPMPGTNFKVIISIML